MSESPMIRITVATRGWPVGMILTPPGTLRAYLIAGGFAKPYAGESKPGTVDGSPVVAVVVPAAVVMSPTTGAQGVARARRKA